MSKNIVVAVSMLASLLLHTSSGIAAEPFMILDEQNATQANLPDLPYDVTSFGAARIDDTIYLYGGHTGSAHSYSTSEQSNQLLALNLKQPNRGWTRLATGEKLQGLGLVAHRDRLISIGGFTAKNQRGEEQDLHSQASVRSFDTQTNSWSDLPDLPEGRSSHDAALIGDSIYVVGGWTMQGDTPTQWLKTAWRLDLAAASPQWENLPQPPFERRALAAVAHQQKLFVIGGMDKDGGPTREVQIFDPATNQWSPGPELIGEGQMAGFGAAGWSLSGRLVVTTYVGDVLVLSEDESSWSKVGQVKDARFFHRLVPYRESSLLALGGASMEEGKFLHLEVIPIQ